VNYRNAIRDFIRESVGSGELNDNEDFFELGLVSSMFVMQIVNFLERSFRINIDGEDLVFDSFRTIDAIDGLVSRKLAA
jgi:methoxymalonate biosynthesis acyl carrier protein